MSATDILSKRMHQAHQRALEVVEANASEERAAEVRKHASQAHVRNPNELAEFHSQMLAALAEMYEEAFAASKQTSGKKKS